MLTFPTSLFGFASKEIDIERQTLKGGTAISGEQDITSTDGGGRVFAEFAGGPLIDRPVTLAWRALVTALEEGVTRVIVPFCDTRHQPFGNEHRVPHSDKTPFSDDTLYVGGGAYGAVVPGAALRATSLAMYVVLPQPLLGGEWFAIEHPNKGWRAYRIMSVEVAPDGLHTVSFRPPLREAVEYDTKVELRYPRCLMVADGRPSTRADGRYTEAAVRFIEAP